MEGLLNISLKLAQKGPQQSRYQHPAGMFKKHVLAEAGSRPARPRIVDEVPQGLPVV